MERPLRALAVAVAVAAPLWLGGCSGPKPEPYVERPVAQIYNEALNLLQAGKYSDAAKQFDEVERQHPYSQWAKRAQIMAAFAYYENDDYESSVLAAQRFIDLHPGDPDAAYAYYLIGQCYYEQISDVNRDQHMTRLALQAFEKVVRLFPNSQYGRDAKLKIELAQDQLAGKDMSIGRWYQNRQQYLAAINRFRTVITNYQTTSDVPEALLRLVECYLSLGVVNEAQDAAAVLGYNFPGSTWYNDAYKLLAKHKLLPKRAANSTLKLDTGASG